MELPNPIRAEADNLTRHLVNGFCSSRFVFEFSSLWDSLRCGPLFTLLLKTSAVLAEIALK